MDAVVAPWKRYGQHRLYVNDGTERLGWGNVLTGEITVEVEEAHDVVWRLVKEHPHWDGVPGTEIMMNEVGDSSDVIDAEIVEEVPAPSGPVITRPWRDLSPNKPGEGVRRMAEQKEAEQQAQVGWLMSTFAKLADWHTEERNWRRGAEGEEVIGAEINKLRTQGWYALHSVPVGVRGADIDHVVIGPGGVFTVNTKRHLDSKLVASGSKVWLNGRATDYVKKASDEAARASRLLTAAVGFHVPVQGVLVLTTGHGATIKNHPADVWALEGTDVPDAFLCTGEVLSEGLSREIFEMARRDTTWTVR